MIQGLIDGIFNGISIGAVLLIAALGLAIVFGLMGVINLAHGELMMLGAYTTFVVQNGFKALNNEFLFNLYIFFALIAAFIVAAIAGFILEKGVIRHLYGRPLETLLATWGVSLILRQFVRSVSSSMSIGIGIFTLLFFGAWWLIAKRSDWPKIKVWCLSILLLLSGGISVAAGLISGRQGDLGKPWFSARNIDVTAPAWLRGGLVVELPVGSFQFPYARIFIIILTILCLLAIYWFLNGSAWGLRVRAVTQNRNMSACLGIPTNTVDALTFALGSGLAGVAGCAVSLLGSVGPNLGGNYIVDAFMVVVVGGVGKLVGSIVAALAIGTISYLVGSGTLSVILTNIQADLFQPLIDITNFFATTSMAKVFVFALIIAFLQFKPAGLFPQKGRTVDA
ncbi:MAG: urea ABC transporter permease subunit UrtB [Prochlorotrichaceae cyanobacterium]